MNMITIIPDIIAVNYQVVTSKSSRKEEHLLRLTIQSAQMGEIVILLSAPEGRNRACIVPREVAR